MTSQKIKLFIYSFLLLAFVTVHSIGESSKVVRASENLDSRLENASLQNLDFNGDQISDSVVFNSRGSKNQLDINLSGQANLSVIALPDFGGNSIFFAYDVDADSDTDIVAKSLTTRATVVWLNDGKGNFDKSQNPFVFNPESSDSLTFSKFRKNSAGTNFSQTFPFVLIAAAINPFTFVHETASARREGIFQSFEIQTLLFLAHSIQRRGPPLV